MDELAARMIQLYKGGLNSKQVAKECGVGVKKTQRILRENGVVFRHSQRKYSLNEHVFDSIDNEHAAYWYGFIYADGCVYKTHLQVALGIKDRDHVDRLRAFLESTSPIREEEYDVKRARLTVASAHLTDRLRTLGIVPRRTKSANIIINNVPSEIFHHWLRGFFDGDGCADKRKCIWFASRSIPLLEHIRKTLANEAGRNPDISFVRHTKRNLYYLRYKGYYNAHAVADWLYKDATLWLPRKRHRIDSWKKPMPRAERAKLMWKKKREKEKISPSPL